MLITFFTLFMSIIWSSLLVGFSYFCRKKHFFIRQFGITSLLLLYLFSVLRMAVPYEFPFTRMIEIKGVFNRLWEILYYDARDAGQIPVLTVFAIIWVAVSAVLIVQFICQYARAMKELSAYEVCEDEQCRRIFQQVVSESKKQMKIVVRRSGNISIPMGIGLFRKSIILPDEAYSDSDLYYILRHEYMHFQNNDLFIKILVHIFCCIFWWNPVIYLLKKDLPQTLEIKCDLGVTDGMGNRDKARYLATIVATLKKAGERRRETAFYGATALVSKNYQSEAVERFKIVSGNFSAKKNILLTVLWFLMFMMLFFASYSFVLQPAYDTPIDEIETGPGIIEMTPENTYLIKHADGTYITVLPGGEEDDTTEEWALRMESQGFKVYEEEIK